MHEEYRFVSPIYSTFFRCLGSQQQHNSGGQIPYQFIEFLTSMKGVKEVFQWKNTAETNIQ